MVKEPFLSVVKKSLFSFAIRAEVILKTNNGILQKCKHQHFLGLLVESSLMGRLVLRLDQDVRLKQSLHVETPAMPGIMDGERLKISAGSV